AYMMNYYTPSGDLEVPVLTLHTAADPLTTSSHTRTYADYAAAAGKGDMVRLATTHQAGHCNFTQAEVVAAIEALDQRITTGRWDAASAEALNGSLRALGQAEARFIDYTPHPMLRPCSRLSCPGAPASAMPNNRE